jgi:hypothetical protein
VEHAAASGITGPHLGIHCGATVPLGVVLLSASVVLVAPPACSLVAAGSRWRAQSRSRRHGHRAVVVRVIHVPAIHPAETDRVRAGRQCEPSPGDVGSQIC